MISRERPFVEPANRASSSFLFVLIAAHALLLGGCLERKLKALNPCLVSGVAAEIAITNIDKIDLLFMVDNSGSMKEEQAALRDQFPKLVQVLTSGNRMDGPPDNDFPPATDLHLGVITSDMGLIGIDDIKGCMGFGDDGLLQNTPSPRISGCTAMAPKFVSFKANDPGSTPTKAATDFGCIADVGTDGCGFEQQLESTLKALWPNTPPVSAGGTPPPPAIFLGDAMGFGTMPHGDNENNGFLRNDATMGLSLIAIILVTDEEDCSTGDTTIFTPADYLDPADPLAKQDLNLRCFYNSAMRYPLTRYENYFKALRPGAENLVIFGAITGVPPDLVSPDKIAAVDFDDEPQRNAFYDKILADGRMMEAIDPSRTPEQGGNLLPSCDTATGKAYPPRRIVDLARSFGANGVIQSICQDDFGPAIDAIIAVIAKQLGAVCLPRPLVANSEGLVPCNVVWELPVSGTQQAATPIECNDSRFPFLQPPAEGRDAVSKKGGAVCQVAQLAVSGVGDAKNFQDTVDPRDKKLYKDGWFYDTFTADLAKGCFGSSKQRVAFTPAAKPPTGVTVKLECLNETQNLANNRNDVNAALEQPEIGEACENITRNGVMLTGDKACEVQLLNNKIDNKMFCHPGFKVCVLGCTTNADCAAGWVCDNERELTLKATVRDGAPNGTPYCVNPICGAK
jgi:hypothetical protein